MNDECRSCAGLAHELLLVLASYGFFDTLGTISRQLGVHIAYTQELSHYDDHGGFHGDGASRIVLKVSADPGMASGADMFHRSSFNFTLGIYDTENSTLYVCALDT